MASVYRARPFEEQTATDWDRQLNVDLRAGYLVRKLPCPTCGSSQAAASSTSQIGLPPAAAHGTRASLPYLVAKRGVIALTEALALELACRADPGQLHRARADRRAAGHERRGDQGGGEGHPTQAVGRGRRNCKGGFVPRRERLRDWRDNPRGRRTAPQIGRPFGAVGRTRPASSRWAALRAVGEAQPAVGAVGLVLDAAAQINPKVSEPALNTTPFKSGSVE